MSLGFIKRRSFMLGYEWHTVNGTGNIHLPNSMWSNFRNIKLIGNSVHKTYAGTQLFDASKLSTTSSGGATVTNNGDGSFTISGTGTLSKSLYTAFNYTHSDTIKLLKAGKITFNALATTNPKLEVSFRNNTDAFFIVTNALNPVESAEIKQEYLDDPGCYLSISFYAAPESTIRSGTIIPMLYQDGNGEWEPFTGGKPVAEPSPDIPLEIESCGKRKKNLLDFKTAKIYNSVKKPEMLDNGFVLNATEANNRILYCECNLKAGKTYVLSYKSNKISGSANARVSNHFPEINQYFNSGKPVVPNRDVSKIGFYVDMENVPAKFEITDVQVEEGTTVTAYEPYSEQIITLEEPIILNGLKVNSGGNYTDSNGQQWICDEIDFKRGKYVQRILKTKPKKTVVFQSRDDNTGRCVVFDENIFGAKFKTGEVPALSTFAPYSEWANYGDCSFSLSNSGFYYKDSTKTLEEVNAIFEKLGTNFEICGVLETPIEHDLPLEIIGAYKELHTNYPTTVITNDAGADMEVSYVADTKLYIDNKLKELVTANQAYTANLLSLMPMETQAAMIENDTNRILESEVTQ